MGDSRHHVNSCPFITDALFSVGSDCMLHGVKSLADMLKLFFSVIIYILFKMTARNLQKKSEPP